MISMFDPWCTNTQSQRLWTGMKLIIPLIMGLEEDVEEMEVWK